MASADVQTLQNAYEAFNRGDMPAVLGVMDPDIEWNEPGGGRAPSGTFHGAQSVGNDVFSAVPENFEEFTAEPERFFEAFADHVIVVGQFRAKPKGGGDMTAAFAHVWQMRNGKPARFHNYVDAAAWAPGWGAS
ncbi:MAG: nuclear transport factor 2 family protein [Solirubrobacterales bacterium]|nr:nuclear transport factor 2 family protein [Solirubrobacterales bacterium]